MSPGVRLTLPQGFFMSLGRCTTRLSQQQAWLLSGDPNTSEQPGTWQQRPRLGSGKMQLPALGGRQHVPVSLQVPAASLAPDLPDGRVAPEDPPLLPGVLFSLEMEMSYTPRPQVCCRDSADTNCTKQGGHG